MTTFSQWMGRTSIYKPSDISEMLRDAMDEAPTVRTGKKITYYDVPCAFDIETTSFYDNGEKRAIMYEWTLGINGAVMIGRTWEEFLSVYAQIVEALELDHDKRLIIYIHNMSFEFQFIRKHFRWADTFSLKERKPIYAITAEGVEFRCSYLLSGFSLAMLGKQLRKYPVQKMEGDLDYSLPRHSATPLTEKEIGYCVNDVKVVMAYIKESMERDGNITRIPLTKTGYVRRYCRDSCLYNGNHKKTVWKFQKYRNLMQSLTLEPEEYTQLKRAFQGGFTHANAFYSGKVLHNVGSYDFTSSYPAVMVSEKFPMSRGEEVEITGKEQFERNLALYCCLFDVEIYNLESTTLVEHPLSLSRCRNARKFVEDNGRLVECEYLRTTLTEQDYFILQKFYRWKKMRVGNFRRYKKAYLPTDFVKSILKLYEDKTILKNVEGKEDEYLRSKEMINSCYGMTVTDIRRDTIIYADDLWGVESVDTEETIAKYNKNIRRFLFYPWGVWITAYARKNLFTGIYEFGTDYIYSDTDSIKAVNIDNHRDFIEAYNKRIISKLERACDFHGIPREKIRPRTIEGKEKPLGVWDFEGIYTRFKTLGAKRYMVEKEGKISITVSGINKKFAVPYMEEVFGDNIFDGFSDGLYIPPERTGKNTHTYIDDPHGGLLKDYRGDIWEYHEESAVHLENADYALSLGAAYVDYLSGITEYSK